LAATDQPVAVECAANVACCSKQRSSIGDVAHHLGQGCRDVACSSASKGCSCSCSSRSWGSSHSGLLAANFATGWSADIEDADHRCCCCCCCCCNAAPFLLLRSLYTPCGGVGLKVIDQATI
jgi:hypothetical protein